MFPLFDTLYRKVRNNLHDLSSDEKRYVADNIKTFGKAEHEIIWALIRTYQIKFDSIKSYIIPYNGKKLKRGTKFDLDKLPIILKHILHEFVSTHLNSTSTLQ
jgi:hypothetical protein